MVELSHFCTIYSHFRQLFWTFPACLWKTGLSINYCSRLLSENKHYPLIVASLYLQPVVRKTGITHKTISSCHPQPFVEKTGLTHKLFPVAISSQLLGKLALLTNCFQLLPPACRHKNRPNSQLSPVAISSLSSGKQALLTNCCQSLPPACRWKNRPHSKNCCSLPPACWEQASITKLFPAVISSLSLEKQASLTKLLLTTSSLLRTGINHKTISSCHPQPVVGKTGLTHKLFLVSTSSLSSGNGYYSKTVSSCYLQPVVRETGLTHKLFPVPISSLLSEKRALLTNCFKLLPPVRRQENKHYLQTISSHYLQPVVRKN